MNGFGKTADSAFSQQNAIYDSCYCRAATIFEADGNSDMQLTDVYLERVPPHRGVEGGLACWAGAEDGCSLMSFKSKHEPQVQSLNTSSRVACGAPDSIARYNGQRFPARLQPTSCLLKGVKDRPARGSGHVG